MLEDTKPTSDKTHSRLINLIRKFNMVMKVSGLAYDYGNNLRLNQLGLPAY